MSILRVSRPVLAALALPAAALIAIPVTMLAASGSAKAGQPGRVVTHSGATVTADTQLRHLPIGPDRAGLTTGAGTGAAAGAVTPDAANGLMATLEYGPNWAGYVASGAHFRYVQARFIVPRVSCRKTPGTTRTPAMAADWVGLDGFNQTRFSVEQDGISAQCVNGVPSYGAWWEMYPRAPLYPGVTVRPGDQILASVWYNPKLHKYRLNLADLTDGEGFSQYERCGMSSCQNVSAEVITESPALSTASNAKYYPLADLGTSTFWNIKITDRSGQRGSFTAGFWQDARLVMIDNGNRVKATTSGLAAGGTAFRTYWEHAN